MSFRSHRSLLIPALWLFWAVALARMGQSLWLDEGMSVWFARLPWPHLLGDLCDPHPPGYYLLLKGWMQFGASEGWLRFPSLVAATLAVVWTDRQGRDSGDGAAGRLAAVLLALHPLQAWYAAEVRMYALVQLAGVLIFWSGRRLLDKSRRRHWLVYILVASVALWIDLSVLFYVGLLQLVWIARGYPRGWRWPALHVVVLLPVALWWLFAGDWRMVADGYHATFLAIQAGRLGIPLPPDVAARLLQGAALVLAGGALALAWGWRKGMARHFNRPSALWLIGLAWLLLLVFCTVPRFFTIKRILVVALPVLALVTAHALHRLPRPWATGVMGLGILATLLTLPTHGREPWRAVVGDLARTASATTDVLWVDDLAVPVFDYYWRAQQGPGPAVDWFPFLTYALPDLPDPQPTPAGTLWVLAAESTYRAPLRLLPSSFYAEYEQQAARREPGIGLYALMHRRASVADDALPSPTPMDWWGLQMPSPLRTCE